MKVIILLVLFYVQQSDQSPVDVETRGVNRRFDDGCGFCIDATHRNLHYWIEYINNATIPTNETCTSFCAKIPDIEAALVCDLYCPQYEIHNFLNFIKGSYEDPVYFCEQASECFNSPGGAADAFKASVSPKVGRAGVERIFVAFYNVTKPVGPGQFIISIETVDGLPFKISQFTDGTPVGPYGISAEINTVKKADCHPNVKPCETWKPGKYTINYKLCNCLCGSKAPISEVYFQGHATFTISANSTA
ncbi:hypothetical protein SNE40_011129 [Patella caerulea]|uniref:Uncharacterized protein n=1 Tax=Patella caerulea TaxID=87958 RepID=A0AAN8PSF7_PATCE